MTKLAILLKVAVFQLAFYFIIDLLLTNNSLISAIQDNSQDLLYTGPVRSLVWLYQLFVLTTNFWSCGARLHVAATLLLNATCSALYPVPCLLQQILSHNLGTEPNPFLGLNGSYFYICRCFFTVLVMFRDTTMCLCAAWGLRWL